MKNLPMQNFEIAIVILLDDLPLNILFMVTLQTVNLLQ